MGEMVLIFSGQLQLLETLLLSIRRGFYMVFWIFMCIYILHYTHTHACIGLASFFFSLLHSISRLCIPDSAVRHLPETKMHSLAITVKRTCHDE
jgi:hypothetical protein